MENGKLETMQKWSLEKGWKYIEYFMDHFEKFLIQDKITERSPCEATYAECYR